MAEKLLKAKKRKIDSSVGGEAMTSPREIALVGTYKEKQLAWIKKNGVYNYPVKDGDEFDAGAFAKIRELWLYADAKGRRHCFAAEFAGKMTREEFVAAYPTYAKLGRETSMKSPKAQNPKLSVLGKSENREYYVFKTSFLDYGPKLKSPDVLIRAMDFATGRGRARLVKKAFDQYKADGEFAPLSVYLPSELSQVPRQQLRVCEAAVQMDFSPFWMSPVLCPPIASYCKSSLQELGRMLGAVHAGARNERAIRVIELFAGVGGFRVGLERKAA